MAKAVRPGKIFVDWSQNARHKTTIGVVLACGPASGRRCRRRSRGTRSRPAPTATIALRFEVADVLDRVDEHGDLFEPVLTLEQRLPMRAERHPTSDGDDLVGVSARFEDQVRVELLGALGGQVHAAVVLAQIVCDLCPRACQSSTVTWFGYFAGSASINSLFASIHGCSALTVMNTTLGTSDAGSSAMIAVVLLGSDDAICPGLDDDRQADLAQLLQQRDPLGDGIGATILGSIDRESTGHQLHPCTEHDRLANGHGALSSGGTTVVVGAAVVMVVEPTSRSPVS